MAATVQDLFDETADVMTGRFADVTLGHKNGGRGFGSHALRTGAKIFAMVADGALVVKLPKQRVAQLIEEGTGSPFDAGKGRPMNEWVSLSPGSVATCLRYATEARAFVSDA